MRLQPILPAVLAASLLAACATTHEGPVTEQDVAAIKVGTSRADVVAAAGPPLAEVSQPPGACLQYETGTPGQSRPYYVVLTPNDRVYEMGYDRCENVARHG